MPDVVDVATRSRMMSGIKGANTGPELRVRRRMHATGLRYRLRSRDLPGRPDLVFRPIRTVVFVHGCFWHQHPGCRFATRPSTNSNFWVHKFQENAKRDLRVERQLAEMGWTVLILWECAADEDIDSVVADIQGRRRVPARA